MRPSAYLEGKEKYSDRFYASTDEKDDNEDNDDYDNDDLDDYLLFLMTGVF